MNSLLKLAIIAILIGIPNTLATDGTISFQYFANGTANDKPITKPGGTPVDSSFTVGIFTGNQVGNPSAFPFATVPIFQNTGLFQNPFGDVFIPGTTPGQPAIITLKVWDGVSYATAANWRAEISFTTQPLGGPNLNPPPPAFTSPDLSGPTPSIGFHGIVVGFPEPTTYALTVLGLVALGISRQRNSPK